MENAVVRPISKERVEECEFSARFWSGEIPQYAEHMRTLADRYAIISTILSAVTGLAIWSSLVSSPEPLAVIVVGAVSVLAAIVSAVPKIKGYGDCAVAASILGPRYGHALGELRDALDMLKSGHKDGSTVARHAVEEFEEVKKEKDALRPYPVDLAKKKDALLAKQIGGPTNVANPAPMR